MIPFSNMRIGMLQPLASRLPRWMRGGCIDTLRSEPQASGRGMPHLWQGRQNSTGRSTGSEAVSTRCKGGGSISQRGSVAMGCTNAGALPRVGTNPSIPPKNYTKQFSSPTRIVAQSIGICRSPYVERADTYDNAPTGTPHQPSTSDEHMMGEEVREGVLELFPELVPLEALQDLEGFDHIWCIFYCHLNAMNVDEMTGANRWNATVKPPRGKRKVGTLATRAPHRPNPIGLSALKVLRVDSAARKIHVSGLDLLDGTPIVDIKPYIRHFDAIPDAKAGWLDDL